MRAIICGGRDFSNYLLVKQTLAQYPLTLIIHGGATGADSLAHTYAREHSIPTKVFPAFWRMFGKSAGMRRNLEMLEEKPDVVIAFPGGRGTVNMVAIATQAGVQTILVGE